jgi:hypothetical protein
MSLMLYIFVRSRGGQENAEHEGEGEGEGESCNIHANDKEVPGEDSIDDSWTLHIAVLNI